MSRGALPRARARSVASDPCLQRASLDSAPPGWEAERAKLLEMLAQQQRLAQAGLVTAGLAHEVSNHLMRMSGSAYMALRGRDPAAWCKALDAVQKECDDLAQTMETLLTFVRKRKSGSAMVFSFSQVMRDATRLLRPLARRSGVVLEFTQTGDAHLRGDQRLAVQALVNLGSNAIQACDLMRGTLTFHAHCVEGQPCTIEVTDDGPGIPEDMRGRLFRPFATGHRDTGGRGMGLFVVRQAVRRLGGAIRVETSPKGTSFRLEFPTAKLLSTP